MPTHPWVPWLAVPSWGRINSTGKFKLPSWCHKGLGWELQGNREEPKQFGPDNHQQCFPLGHGFHPSRSVLFLLRT